MKGIGISGFYHHGTLFSSLLHTFESLLHNFKMLTMLFYLMMYFFKLMIMLVSEYSYQWVTDRDLSFKKCSSATFVPSKMLNILR